MAGSTGETFKTYGPLLIPFIVCPLILVAGLSRQAEASLNPNPGGQMAAQTLDLSKAEHLQLLDDIKKYTSSQEYLIQHAIEAKDSLKVSTQKLRAMFSEGGTHATDKRKDKVLPLLDSIDDQASNLGSADQKASKAAADQIIAAVNELNKILTITDQAFPLAIRGEEPKYTDSYGQGRPSGRVHRGTDLLTPIGTDVIAVADGVITRAGCCDAWGKYKLTIKPDSGSMQYFYAHIINVKVKNGDRVTKGQVIAQSGDANNVPHLHFGIKVPCDTAGAARERSDLGTCWINPVPFLESVDPRK